MSRKDGYQTKNRQLMEEYLLAQKERMITAKDICEYMESLGFQISNTTVYRYLEQLEKKQKVIAYVSKSGEKGYQYIAQNHECNTHLHLQCSSCGKVIHLDCEFMKEIAAHIEDHHGFQLECKGSLILGMCKECQKMK